MNMQTATWSYPTQIVFGPETINDLPKLCRKIGIANPLLVTDHGMLGLDCTDRVFAACRAEELTIDVFTDFKLNPVKSDIDTGVKHFTRGKHDGVISFGGGSSLDVGKLIAFMAGQSRVIGDFEDIGDWWKRADIEGIAPVIAIPTTAGTGSEVGRAGVIVDEESHSKKIIFHPEMLAKVVILDPELTVNLPAHLTAATGMDALAHCIEAYCTPHFHPLSQGVAAEGARLIIKYLPNAYKNGSDLEARGKMLIAASMGAVAFQKGLGAMHALAHPIGALCDTHHGLTNAVLMPYVIEFNRAEIETKICRLAAYSGMDDASFDGFLGAILSLRSALNIPNTLREIGVDESYADKIAVLAVDDPSAGGNPIKMTTENSRSILRAAFGSA